MSEKSKSVWIGVLAALLLFMLLGLALRPSAPAPASAATPAPSPVPTVLATPAGTAPPRDYVLNNHTRRFHYPDCKSVDQILEKNREDVFASRDELLARGFKSCGNCKP